ncbi:glycoside hydrolase family 36 protein [Paenibacillus flagellatus]|uniref:Alpha-galactosidase n=1 Tax=Paenibacillus flagellatus TaxID=2211139 RepID=A0A2V5KAV5_9BACL|nr:glycoside hydrolase family 36 protein [Paenibacillus flagellatus]PYI56618.1 alpha-galactosidase [Paenibacillus flagellatus]
MAAHRLIAIRESGIHLHVEITEDGDVRLRHFSPFPEDEARSGSDATRSRRRIVELQASGEDHNDHHGAKYTGTMPAGRLVYAGHSDTRNEAGRKLEVALEDGDTLVTVHYQFYDGIAVIRAWTEVTNRGAVPLPLEYVSSFALTGIDKEGEGTWETKSRLHVPHNTWHGELQWRGCSLPELGLTMANAFSVKRLNYGSSGTWSSAGYVPMGCYENTAQATALVWQIEHNGSWHWEIGDAPDRQLYLQLSGPTEAESHWWKRLSPGETFVSVPVAVGVVRGGFGEAIAELTRYRRAVRRPHADNERLPIIFNDYMNCLFADPTTEKLLPLIDAAAEAGCEYFCIDAGWYADGPWWDAVGVWQPSTRRFPGGGLQAVLDHIRAKGMIPGLWLELEVMGVHCPIAADVPDEWFFVRHGRRVIDHGRYQLDYRHPDVVRYADEVIDRLVTEYGVGYIKMDYNINAGIGTEIGADSFGDGLLQHNRAYLGWLDRVFERYPQLIIENCGSGGMRMDYAMLARHSVQSISDQTDYRRMAAIAAAAPTALTPEQAAVWSYPLKDGDEEEVVFNMVNAMLMRVHQSGLPTALAPERFALLREGLDYYKSIRHRIPQSLPFWPIGLPKYGDDRISLGLRCGDKAYVAVWSLNGGGEAFELPISFLSGKEAAVRCGYPQRGACDLQWNAGTGTLTVTMPPGCRARIVELEPITN